MITSLSIEDASGNAVPFHGAPGRALTSAAGLPGVAGIAGPRDSSYSRPGGDGAITRSRWQKPATVTLEGFVSGATPAEALAALDAITVPLVDSIAAPALMLWDRTDGLALQASARLAGDVNVAQEAAGRLLRFQASVRCDDPRAYTQALTTAVGGTLALGGGFTAPFEAPFTADPAAGGTVAVSNAGTRPTPPVFRIYGYVTSPQLVLIGTDARIALTGTVAPGDYVEVDVQARTVKINGTGPAQGMVDSANTTWIELPRGTSTLQLLAGANDTVARCDVLYRSCYA